MKWIASLTLFLALTVAVHADGPDDQYLDIYNKILQAEGLQQGGRQDLAAAKFLEAQTALQKLHTESPGWNAAVVSFRLDYLAGKMKELAAFLPTTNAAPAAVVVAATNAAPATAADLAELRGRVDSLTAANEELEKKLKEALSVQPASTDPRELAKAEDKILMLEKERDLLSVTLDQQQAGKGGAGQKPPATADATKQATELAAVRARSSEDAKTAEAEISQLKQAESDSGKKLAAAEKELSALKAREAATPAPGNEVKDLTAERDRLKKELASVSKELADREAHPNGPPASAATAAKLKQAEQERDDLAKQVTALTKAAKPGAPPAAANDAEVGQLRARLAVLEAKAVPYNAQELAALNAAPTAPPAIPAPATPTAKPTVHSIKDLPPGSGPMMADAERDVMLRNYDDAEKKYLEVLRQDENNVYVLAKLAGDEYANGRYDDCDTNVQRALALDPNDPGSLFLLGILRYHQQKLDAALDALSRSASINSTNAGTEYYLGCVLEAKGLRPAAETAFRKSLEFDPNSADAHYSLAVVYAEETPPSLALARWHYQKAVDMGHPKNEGMDKIIEAK